MTRPIIITGIAILMSGIYMPLNAALVHKWVDADGITHYSDEAPDPSATKVTVMNVDEASGVNANTESDYYSIKNQWQRLHKERLEYEKIRLEKARQLAVQQASNPQVVYVSESREKEIVVAYPAAFYKRHKSARFHRKHRRGSVTSVKNQRLGKPPVGLHPGRLKLGAYQTIQ